MKRLFTEKEKIESKIDEEIELQGDYDHCQFINCNLSDQELMDLSFVDCTFIGCNLSLVKLDKTIIRKTIFKNCKLMGVNFEMANENLENLKFEHSVLNLSSFYKRKLKK